MSTWRRQRDTSAQAAWLKCLPLQAEAVSNFPITSNLCSSTAQPGLRSAQAIYVKGKSLQISAAGIKLNPPNGGNGTCCGALRPRHKRPLGSWDLSQLFWGVVLCKRRKIHPAVAFLMQEADGEMPELERHFGPR